MATFDRSKFKATSVAALQEQAAEIEQKTKKKGRAEVLRPNTDGSQQILRIAPKHPEAKSWIYGVKTSFLSCQKKDKDGALMVENGQPVIGQKPIFHATFHGKTINGENFEKDLLDFYMQKVYALSNDIQDKEERQKFLNPVTGYRKSDKFIGGIKPQLKYMVYGWLNGVFGRIELPGSIRKELNTIAAQSDQEDGPIVTDPFTDPDTGASVVISFDKNETEISKKWKVTINLKDVRNPTPLTDAQFEEFASQKPLQELYEDVYSSRDMELCLEGLQRFDETNKYRIFEDEEFLNEVEAFAELVKEYKKTDVSDDTDSDSDEVEEKEEKEVYVTPTIDQINSMSKADLKECIEELGLEIKILPTFKVESIRMMVAESLGLDVSSEDSIEEEDDSNENTVPQVTQAMSLKEKLAALKAKA